VIKVVLSGAGGKMGQMVAKTLNAANDIKLVGAIDPFLEGTDLMQLINTEGKSLIIESDLSKILKESQAEVMVDFSTPQAVLQNVLIAVANKVAAVVGTTGLRKEDLNKIEEECQKNNVPVFIAPNFAIGAVLLMIFATQAVKHMPDAEIIELHHAQKLDAPSGTALRTKELMQKESSKENFPIHSVRLPGLVAHQEVIFGSEGQTLTLRHDSLGRESFMPGVLLAIRRVLSQKGLVVGLENLLEI